MNEWGPTELHNKVRLKDLLQGTRQPVSEEQAWALCYQCSCKLKQMILGDGYFPELRGIEHIYIHQDGAVSFVGLSDAKDLNLSETRASSRPVKNERSDLIDCYGQLHCSSSTQVIEHLGKTVYSALDWGLSSEIERVLSDSMNSLLFYMLGLNTTSSSTPTTQRHAVTLNYIIKASLRPVKNERSDLIGCYGQLHHSSSRQVCAERLFVPSKASTHYRTVCRMQHAEFKSVHNLLQTIQLTKQSLRRLDSHEELIEDVLVMYDNWGTLWSNVMKELRRGVNLRSVDQRSYNALPIKYTLTPYELLMDDIRSKRYTLRPVEECDQSKSSRSEDNVILDLIRTHILKPASERKLKERSLEEPSLHDLLMSEIKSSKKLRSTLDVHRNALQDEEFKISSNLCSVQRGNKWNLLPVFDPLDNGICGRISWHPEFSSESSSEHKFSDLTSSSTDLSFFPVLTSSQVDLRMNSMSSCDQTSYTHKRSNSYESSFQRSSCRQRRYTPRIWLPLTISELIPVRREMVKTEMLVLASSKDFPGYKACSSCYRKRLFFTWLFSCKFCDRAICPECHIEMLMPFKQCMHLPVSFFKALVFTRDNDPFSQAQKNQVLFQEIMQWDCSSVPLVFDTKADDHSFRKRVTHNWTSMDICIKCEDYILDVLDKNHQREFPDSFLKSRSISESSAILPRH